MDFKNLRDKEKEKVLSLETPFFIFDLDIIGQKYDKIKQEVSPNIFYALKCNSLPEVLSTLVAKGSGFEINNMNELEKVLSAGGKASDCINSIPITSARDVKNMYGAGVNQFCFDSKEMIDNLSINAKGCNALLRIYSSNKGSKFDVSQRLGAHETEESDIIRYALEKGIAVKGVNFHVGSQCYNVENWDSALNVCSELFKEFDLEIINIGGGFPIQYNGKNPEISQVSSVIDSAINRYFKTKPTIQTEPGRYIVGDSGMTVSSVIQIKEMGGLLRAIVDTSVFAGHIEILENGTGFTYPTETNTEGEDKTYKIGGCSCAGADVMNPSVQLPQLKVDFVNPSESSRVFFLNTGAYTTDYIALNQSSGFNGTDMPKVYFMKNGELIK